MKPPREMIQRKGIRRVGVPLPGGEGTLFQERAEGTTYERHAHADHQLLYCVSGRIILRTGEACWLLPTNRAAWIPAETLHSTTLDRAEIVSVLFKAKPQWSLSEKISIFPAEPLLREMLLHFVSPGGDAEANPDLRKSLLETLALLCREWIRRELPFRLPNSADPGLAKAIDYALGNLDTVNLESAARAGGCSVRTFRRRFLPATGLTWAQYIHQARMLQAMDQLLVTGKSVLETGLSVGYDSPSAFTRAFHLFAGMNPAAFRQVRPGAVTALAATARQAAAAGRD